MHCQELHLDNLYVTMQLLVQLIDCSKKKTQGKPLIDYTVSNKGFRDFGHSLLPVIMLQLMPLLVS